MWKEENNALVKEFKFTDFKQAFAFMSKVAVIAEEQQHHPDWSNVYNRVKIKLNTHDEGDIVTEKDIKLAEAIDKLI